MPSISRVAHARPTTAVNVTAEVADIQLATMRRLVATESSRNRRVVLRRRKQLLDDRFDAFSARLGDHIRDLSRSAATDAPVDQHLPFICTAAKHRPNRRNVDGDEAHAGQLALVCSNWLHVSSDGMEFVRIDEMRHVKMI